MFVIATDSRHRDEVLFMVDRNRQRASFWSNRLDDAMKYGDKPSAQKKATKLTLQDAARIAGEQARHRDLEQAMADGEAGWDGHKGHF
jgi:hypothetical protein